MKLHSQLAGFPIAFAGRTGQNVFTYERQHLDHDLALQSVTIRTRCRSSAGTLPSPWLKLDFADVKPMHKAFKPMVREHAYDASEMALVTCFQAKIYNKGLQLLPAAMLRASSTAPCSSTPNAAS